MEAASVQKRKMAKARKEGRGGWKKEKWRKWGREGLWMERKRRGREKGGGI